MPGTLDWGDTENIAILLANRYPDLDPLVGKDWIARLAEFGGDPQAASEAQLEDVRMAWHGEYTKRHWDAGPNPILPF